MKEALFYSKLNNKQVRCNICPHNCIIDPDQTGICRSRKNTDGTLYAVNYGKTITVSIDPMEKKPLYHFYPGRQIISIGANSCNLSCKFCQNYQSSQQNVSTTQITPQKLLELCRTHSCKFVAFTYTEPATWYEFVLDSSKILQENSVKVVLVTNGFINKEPLEELLPYIDAMNIDLKSYDDKFYKDICNGSLEPVLETIRIASERCHLEVTNLLITNENDSYKQVTDLVDFIAGLDNNIPLHFSRYFPTYKMTNPPTPISTLEKAREIAEQQLNYVYLGNVKADRSTYCPSCNETILKREFPFSNNIQNGKCSNCGFKIYGKF